MDAKVCPDGSYVGRTGPDCEFAPCPGAEPSISTGTSGIPPNGSGIRGIVMLGPLCPVERIPPASDCADRPYQTSVVIFKESDPAHVFVKTKSDTRGIFEVSVPQGKYTVSAGEGTLPMCGSMQVIVKQNKVVSTIVTCDTGIR